MGRRVNLAELAADAVTEAAPPRSGVTELLVDDIAPNPLNQRDEADEDPDELARMTATMGEHGVLQPLVACTTQAFLESYPDQRDALAGARWVTLIGNRRLAAARAAGLERVPVVVNNERTNSMYEVMLVENSHRRDLAPLGEAQAMNQVLEQQGISQRELAKRVGRTHTYVQQRLALLTLIPPLRAALAAGTLTVERARELGALSESEQQEVAAAGPPFRLKGAGNGVATRGRRTIPPGDPRSAAKSIRALYSGDQLAELIRLLSTDDEPGSGER